MPKHQNIREICARLLLAQNEEQFQATMTELKIAFREHVAESENRGTNTMSLEVPSRKAASNK